jgi:nucleoid-associated protein YgaU
MVNHKGLHTSYFAFVIILFLGIFIYLGWFLSNGAKERQSLADGGDGVSLSANTPAGASANGKGEKSAIKISNVKPVSVSVKNSDSKTNPASAEGGIFLKPDNDKKISLSARAKTSKSSNDIFAVRSDKSVEEKNNSNDSLNSTLHSVIVKHHTEERIYIVRTRDTLTGIAKRQLGSASRWREIARLNADVLPNPHKLKTGIRLRIPGKSYQEKIELYTVKEEDSLYSLAVRFYGSPSAVTIIRQANFEKLGSNGEISEGMNIRIPLRSFNGNESGSGVSSVPDGGSRRYIIRQGDTLSEISKKFYNKSTMYDRIIKANPNIKDEKNLKVGSSIIIPEKE